MARKRYDVVYRGQMWQVTHASSTLTTHVAKDPAVDAGIRVAKANTPSQLLIHRANGTLEDERTFGDDPHPPTG
jgi:hypothetical protein